MKTTVVNSLLAGLFLVVCAGAAVHLVSPTPTTAQEPQCSTLQEVLDLLNSHNETTSLLDARELVGVDAEGIGKIIVTTVNGGIALGFERDGCVIGPIMLGKIETSA